jgi:hypothetical protein
MRKDYTEVLNRKAINRTLVERTRKQPGDWIEVWRDGAYRWVKHGEEQAA